MKKLSIVILILGFAVSMASAQERFVCISGGYTIPYGDFATSDAKNLNSGYALNGYNVGFDISYFISDYFGFGTNLRFSSCKPDVDFFNQLLNEKFGSQMDTINYSATDYNLHNFLLGPVIKADIGDYFAIYGKVFIGVMSTYKPIQTLEYKPIGEELISKETVGDYTGSFGYNFGVGVIVKFTSKIGLNISADYIAGKPIFEKYNLETLEIIEVKQPISFYNLNAGIILSL